MHIYLKLTLGASTPCDGKGGARGGVKCQPNSRPQRHTHIHKPHAHEAHQLHVQGVLLCTLKDKEPRVEGGGVLKKGSGGPGTHLNCRP